MAPPAAQTQQVQDPRADRARGSLSSDPDRSHLEDRPWRAAHHQRSDESLPIFL
jgi:hypothetical protein